MALTIVTALYDLSATDTQRPRSMSHYRELALKVLQLPFPMIIYTDGKELETFFQSRDPTITRIISRPLDQFQWAQCKSKVARNVERHPLPNPQKNTILYRILNWSKFDMMVESIESNPFQTQAFAWMDMGIAHVAEPSAEVLRQLPLYDHKFHVLSMRTVVAAEIRQPESLLTTWNGNMVGGFWFGRSAIVREICTVARDRVRQVIADGYAPLEDTLLAWVCTEQRDKVCYYYGDYKTIFQNIHQIKGDTATVLYNLQHCIRHQALADATLIAQAMLRSPLWHTLTLADQKLVQENLLV